jgi:hypothetical protein
MLSEPILVVVRLVQAFDALGVAYVVGGSLASSVYGIPRATQDVDLVADLKSTDAEELERLLSGDFYVDGDMIRDAIARRASFNVIHLATMFKADVFIMKPDAWSREEMSRARQEKLDGPDGAVAIRFASPEDTLLHKLVWFRLGKEISDRQWSDILGVLKIQGESVDTEYLERWAPVLGVADLLVRARNQL